MILKNTLNYCIVKCGYGNFNHRYNISPIHLEALLGMENFTNVAHVCAYRLWSDQRLPKVWETMAYTLQMILTTNNNVCG